MYGRNYCPSLTPISSKFDFISAIVARTNVLKLEPMIPLKKKGGFLTLWHIGYWE